MSKELIEQARDYTYQGDSWQLQQRLADLIEQQQKRIEEQALQVLSAQAQAQENYEQLAAAQAQLVKMRDQLAMIARSNDYLRQSQADLQAVAIAGLVA